MHTKRIYRIAVGFFFFLQGLTFSSWASRIPDIKHRLLLSDGQFGSLLLGLPIGQIATMGLSGYCVSRFGSKKILIIGALSYPLVLVGIGFVTTIWQLVACLFFFGVCGNLSNISVNTQAVGVERLYWRSIMASFHGIWSLAGFIGGLLGGLFVFIHYTPKQHFIIIDILAITTILFVKSYLLPRDFSSAPNPRKFVIPNKSLIRLGCIAFSCMMCEGTMFDWSSIYFEKVVKAPVDLVRLGYISYFFAMFSGRFLADWLVGRVGIKHLLQASGLVMCIGLWLSVSFPILWVSTLGFLLVGFGVSSVVPMVYSMAGKSKDVLPGIAIASVSSIGLLGFLIGPPSIGFISEAFGLRTSFGVVGCLGLVTMLFGRTLKS